jgi:hypothetical protein
MKIRGIGERTARKVRNFRLSNKSILKSIQIEEILQTGELRRIKYENTEDVAITRLFQGIYGVGRVEVFLFTPDDGLCMQVNPRQCNGGQQVAEHLKI